MAATIGVSRAWVFGAFSASLLLAAVLGPTVGRMIDRRGGSRILAASNIVLAVGLAGLALCNGTLSLFAAWMVLGVGMAFGLYDAAFAALAALYGSGARGPITGITLLAGFASTVGWPLSAFLDAEIGWRGTCAVWALMHLVIGLPLNLFLIPRGQFHATASREVPASWKPRKPMVLLAYIFAASWFVTGAMAAHLPELLERTGASATQAVTAAALVGPAQVIARLVEYSIMRHAHPLVSARVATALHPAGAALLVIFGSPASALFALLHGAGNGLLTIARGTVPLALFGAEGYGARTGLLGAPARAAQALAPFLFGLLLDTIGRGVLLVSAGLYLSAFVTLMCLSSGAKSSPTYRDQS
jgi:MFS family permease